MIGLFDFPEEDSQLISNALIDLPLTKNNLINYNSLCEIIEQAKINTIIRLVKSRLDSDQNVKVIVCVKFIDNVNRLVNLLTEYNPLILTSKPSTDNRLIIATYMKFKLFHHHLGNFNAFLTFGIDITTLNNLKIQFVYDKRNEKEINITGRKSRDCIRFIEE